jgi:hypothetical protein
VQSGHRRLVRVGLQLKDHFPQHDVKVDSIQVTDATEGLAQDPVLH